MWWVILALALAVIAIKVVGSMIALTIVRVGLLAAVSGSLLLAQIGELSFVLQRSGSEAGLQPAGLGSAGEQVLIAVTVVLMVATPALSAAGQRVGDAVLDVRATRRPSPAQGSSTPQIDHGGGVLVSGWGPVARSVAAMLSTRSVPVTVTTLNPDLAAEAHQVGHEVVRGDPVRENVLVDAGLHSARLVVICENDEIRQLAPDVGIVARPHGVIDPTSWVDTGTDRVVDFHPDPRTACTHVTQAHPALPSSAGCIDCLRSDRRDWVHLRTCLHCGHVGCCDSSPERHARGHADVSGHSIMASAEPTEAWAWCFLDETRIEPR
ncbi:NAD-binding protein [Janibacter alittae]|uniref:NAD-binding protein n=1 Tax=Janibacter alittae TaxID=3115209 RepID=A0ABZ2MF85_9MICO